MAFFELRQYRVRPGRMDEWVRLMEEKIIPFQTAQGMVVIGSFRGESDDSLFFWVRRFESEADRERLYEAVYGSEFWKNEIAPQIPDFLDRERSVVTRVVPTARSSIQ
ncbi:MAG: NIPSNAP family protein [Bryobacterales bacterium]|nr:NIPSNAP family protein [Bryobacterales bacterium]MDE0625577.1 NIPSNAP family protein [Bryobacterales bacterium]